MKQITECIIIILPKLMANTVQRPKVESYHLVL